MGEMKRHVATNHTFGGCHTPHILHLDYWDCRAAIPESESRSDWFQHLWKTKPLGFRGATPRCAQGGVFRLRHVCNGFVVTVEWNVVLFAFILQVQMQQSRFLVLVIIVVALFVCLYILPGDRCQDLRSEISLLKEELSDSRKALALAKAARSLEIPNSLTQASPVQQETKPVVDDRAIAECKEKQRALYTEKWNTTMFYSDAPLEAFWNSFDLYAPLYITIALTTTTPAATGGVSLVKAE